MTIPFPFTAKAIIFDLDGTLLDSMPLHFKAYQYALEPWSVTYPFSTFESRAGIPSHDTMLMIAQDYDVKDFNVDEALKRKRNYVDSHLNELRLIEPVAEVMRSYFDRFPMAIGTGSHRSMVTEVVDLFSLDEYIPFVVTADDVSNHKPHPETFLKCAELMEVDPKDCVVYEDGEMGIQAAQSASMQVVDVRAYFKQEISL